MSNIKSKTISGFFWTFIQKIGSQGISFLVMILLARMLTPADFGLIAMLAIFIQVSQNVVSGGFNQALIQKLDVDEIDYSSVFFINIIISLFIYVVLFFSAPLVSDFYNQPELELLLRVMSISFVINAFSLVQETKITNDLDFKKLTIINLPSTVIGGAVGLVMAYLGYGVWSIVGLQVATRLSYAIQLWIYAKWIPVLVLDLNRVKNLFSFGGRMLVSTILTSIYSNIVVIVIGKYYLVSQAGFYHNAKMMALTPSTTIKSIADNVTFPTFSKIQNENIKLKVAYKKVMQVLIFWMLPIFTFSAVLADPLFALVFGEKWLPAVPYFRWLCIIAVLNPLVNYNLNILKIKGEAKLFLKLQMYRRILSILGLFLISLFPFGIHGLLFIECLSYFISFLVFSHFSGIFIQYNLKEQVLDKLGMLILTSIVSVILMFSIRYIQYESHFFSVTINFFLGLGFYILASIFLKFEALIDSVSILRSFFRKTNIGEG